MSQTFHQRRILSRPRAHMSDHQRDQAASERAADWCFGAIFAMIVGAAVLKLCGVL